MTLLVLTGILWILYIQYILVWFTMGMVKLKWKVLDLNIPFCSRQSDFNNRCIFPKNKEGALIIMCAKAAWNYLVYYAPNPVIPSYTNNYYLGKCKVLYLVTHMTALRLLEYKCCILTVCPTDNMFIFLKFLSIPYKKICVCKQFKFLVII